MRPGPYGLVTEGAVGLADGALSAWLDAHDRRAPRHGRRPHGRRRWRPRHLPGLVDCHTHLVFGGDRVAEFEARLGGASYEELARQGGGIASTVAATRAADEDDLVRRNPAGLRHLVRDGVTTVEIKSGYGLDLETECRMLAVARLVLGRELRLRGVHDVPRCAHGPGGVPGAARGLRRPGVRRHGPGRGGGRVLRKTAKK